MFTGRKKELAYLEENYTKEGSRLLVIYGHKGVGKSSLLFRFAQNKPLHYYAARPCSEAEQLRFWDAEVKQAEGERTLPAEDLREGTGFEKILQRAAAVTGPVGGQKLLFVVDEFQYLIKYADGFIAAVTRFLKESPRECMVVLLSSSISFVETDFVPRIGSLAMGISGFYKLAELGFMDCVNFFKNYSTRQCMEVYSVLGGIPAYWAAFHPALSVEDNIKTAFVAANGALREEGERIVSAELRELNVYSTILNCLANGENKLNELHLHTGFSRAKISVYLKNLMEREIVEKVFPFDNASSINAKKGIYRISLRFLEFYFRFVFANLSALHSMPVNDFYDRCMKDGMAAFHQSNFRKVCGEYLDILNQNNMLPVRAGKMGEWIGKSGTIDIVMQDKEGESILAFCDWLSPQIGMEKLKACLGIVEEARLHPDHLYLFAAGKFSDEIRLYAADNAWLQLIDIDTL